MAVPGVPLGVLVGGVGLGGAPPPAPAVKKNVTVNKKAPVGGMGGMGAPMKKAGAAKKGKPKAPKLKNIVPPPAASMPPHVPGPGGTLAAAVMGGGMFNPPLAGPPVGIGGLVPAPGHNMGVPPGIGVPIAGGLPLPPNPAGHAVPPMGLPPFGAGIGPMTGPPGFNIHGMVGTSPAPAVNLNVASSSKTGVAAMPSSDNTFTTGWMSASMMPGLLLQYLAPGSYVEIVTHDANNAANGTAIVKVEQVYPGDQYGT